MRPFSSPNRSSVCATACWHSAAAATSARTASSRDACRPSFSVAIGCWSTPQTLWPSASRPAMQAKPMPLAAPVTSTVFGTVLVCGSAFATSAQLERSRQRAFGFRRELRFVPADEIDDDDDADDHADAEHQQQRSGQLLDLLAQI